MRVSRTAGFPREKSLRSFDFDADPNIDPATIHTLASCEWIKKSQPLCLTFNGTIIETGTDSYRLASTRARAEELAKAG